jgi:galactitol-specific phosphotransferase system IIB component
VIQLKKVAVQKGLASVKNYLDTQGYHVEEFDTTQTKEKNFMQKFDAVVVTGMDNNVMGIATTSTTAPIIQANGLSPEDVKNQIEAKAK